MGAAVRLRDPFRRRAAAASAAGAEIRVSHKGAALRQNTIAKADSSHRRGNRSFSLHARTELSRQEADERLS